MLKKVFNKAAGISAALILVTGVFAGCSDSFNVSMDEIAVTDTARSVFADSGDRIYAVAESATNDRLQFKLDLGSKTISAGDEFTFYITYNNHCKFPEKTKLIVRDGKSGYTKWDTIMDPFGEDTGDSNKDGWYPVTVIVPYSYTKTTNQLGFTLNGTFEKGSVIAIKNISIAKSFEASSWKIFSTDTQMSFSKSYPSEWVQDNSQNPAVHVLRDPIIKNTSMLTSRVDTTKVHCSINLIGDDWNHLEDANYKTKIINTFYEVYPKLLARWGHSEITRDVNVYIGNYPDIMASNGSEIFIQTDYANTAPDDLGAFAHEMTHNMQNFGAGFSWFDEGMASYGGFRYFHWQHEDTLQPLNPKSESVINWNDYYGYGDCVPFFVYMDDKYPTHKENGKIVYGLLDTIVRETWSNNKINGNDSEPAREGTVLNNIVRNITGFKTLDALRIQYQRECADGTWTFSGFSNFQDNFLTENIEGVPNADPIYLPAITHGETAEKLSSFSLEENVFKGAKVVRSSGYYIEPEKDAFIVDGDKETKWCAFGGSVKDISYKSLSAQHYILLDMGKVNEFDSYILRNAGTRETSDYNAVSWEILTSTDGTNFTSWDYQTDADYSTGYFTPGTTSARYLLLLVYKSDSDGGDVLRIYELMGGLKE